MSHYLLAMYQPDGVLPPPETLAPAMADLHVMNSEIRAAGAWVFTGGLESADRAHVVRATGSGATTDGPFVEAKEHIGGFWVIDVPDLDAALGWARRAAGATGLPVEVRPFQDEPGG